MRTPRRHLTCDSCAMNFLGSNRISRGGRKCGFGTMTRAPDWERSQIVQSRTKVSSAKTIVPNTMFSICRGDARRSAAKSPARFALCIVLMNAPQIPYPEVLLFFVSRAPKLDTAIVARTAKKAVNNYGPMRRKGTFGALRIVPRFATEAVFRARRRG